MPDYRHTSDWMVLRIADAAPKEHPHLGALAECVRRGLAEDPHRRRLVKTMGPTLSQAQHYLDLAAAQLERCAGLGDEGDWSDAGMLLEAVRFHRDRIDDLARTHLGAEQ